MAISQNAILTKWQSPKSLLYSTFLLLYIFTTPTTFFMNLSETFSIDENMDFANNMVCRFLI